jgi:hypothetical protein
MQSGMDRESFRARRPGRWRRPGCAWALLLSATPLFAAEPLQSLCVDAGHIALQYQASIDLTYQLQAVGGVPTKYWADLAPASRGQSGSQTLTMATQGQAYGFYRLLAFTGDAVWYDWDYYPSDPTLALWGLGSAQEGYAHNDRARDWYIDQADTGAYSNDNCGPSSVTMAIKWHHDSFTGTAEQARQTYRPTGGWWYTSDIVNYLNLKSVPNLTSAFTGGEQLAGLVGSGRICILCLSTAYLAQNAQTAERVGRFYGYAGGHFLVVKGARRVSGALFLEAYDPNNWHAHYADQTPKGRNRHYAADQISSAVANWWNYVIVIPPPGGGGSALADPWLRPVDPARIPDMPGA